VRSAIIGFFSPAGVICALSSSEVPRMPLKVSAQRSTPLNLVWIESTPMSWPRNGSSLRVKITGSRSLVCQTGPYGELSDPVQSNQASARGISVTPRKRPLWRRRLWFSPTSPFPRLLPTPSRHAEAILSLLNNRQKLDFFIGLRAQRLIRWPRNQCSWFLGLGVFDFDRSSARRLSP
jgi:hypothetical protein